MSMLHGSVNRKAIHTLVQRGEDVNGTNRSGETPLIVAASRGNVEALSVLLDYGAEINARDRNGRSALLHAALWHHTNTLRHLLTRGADAYAMDCTGATALMLAAWPEDFEGNRRDDLSTMTLLIASGVEINATDNEGNTALHHLAQDTQHQSGHDALALLLIGAGSDVSIRDKSGRTALNYAEENERAALVATLRQATTSNEVRVDKEERGG